MIDLRDVDVEIKTDRNARNEKVVWININGECALRIHAPKSLEIQQHIRIPDGFKPSDGDLREDNDDERITIKPKTKSKSKKDTHP